MVHGLGVGDPLFKQHTHDHTGFSTRTLHFSHEECQSLYLSAVLTLYLIDVYFMAVVLDCFSLILE